MIHLQRLFIGRNYKCQFSISRGAPSNNGNHYKYTHLSYCFGMCTVREPFTRRIDLAIEKKHFTMKVSLVFLKFLTPLLVFLYITVSTYRWLVSSAELFSFQSKINFNLKSKKKQIRSDHGEEMSKELKR